MTLLWFVSRAEGTSEGPYHSSDIVRYIRERRIDPSAKVCQNGQAPWLRITDVDVFQAALQDVGAPGVPSRAPEPPTALRENGGDQASGPPDASAAGQIPASSSVMVPRAVRIETPEALVLGPTPSSPNRVGPGTRGVKRRRALTGAIAGALVVGGCVLAVVRHGSSTRDARIRQSLVQVVAGDSRGAGFFVNGPDNYAYVATAYHVIDSGDPVRIERMVEVSDKKSYVEAYPSTEVVAVDPDADLAVIRIKEVDAGKFTRLPLAKAPAKDAKIVAYGFPHSNLGRLESSVSQDGKISATTKFSVFDRVTRKLVRASAIDGLIISAQLEPGYSGGPTVNEDDEVVGVNVLKDPEHTAQNGAVNVEVLAKLLLTLTPAAEPVPPTAEEIKALLTKTEVEYLKRPIADRMRVREADFVTSEDLPVVRQLARDVANMSRDLSLDENKLSGQARLGVIFAGLPGRPLGTYRSPEVTGALAACPNQSLSLFGAFRGGKSGAPSVRPSVDCEGYARRALAWDLAISVLQWEDSEHEFTVSSVEPVNSESRSFKATVSAKGSSSSFSVWVSTAEGRLRLKLFDGEGKPYWIDRHGSADAAAFRGAWVSRGTRQRLVIGEKLQLDTKTTEMIDVEVDAEGDARVKHRLLRDWYAESGHVWPCNQRDVVEVGMEQNFSGKLRDGALWLSPTTTTQDGSPRTERIGGDGQRCSSLPVHYTADRLLVMKVVSGRLIVYRTSGNEFPERVDFNR
jgi:S1-C subfamily serine protease